MTDRDLLASLSLGILFVCAQGRGGVGGEFFSPCLSSSDMDAYFRSQELAGAIPALGLVSAIGLGCALLAGECTLMTVHLQATR